MDLKKRGVTVHGYFGPDVSRWVTHPFFHYFTAYSGGGKKNSHVFLSWVPRPPDNNQVKSLVDEK
jgi:hypothetical protein